MVEGPVDWRLEGATSLTWITCYSWFLEFYLFLLDSPSLGGLPGLLGSEALESPTTSFIIQRAGLG